MKSWLVTVAVTVALAACGGDNDSVDKTAGRGKTISRSLSPLATCPPAGADACSGETGLSGDACVYAGSDAVAVRAVVEDFDSGRPLPGAVVHVVENESGEPSGICGVTALDGTLSIRLPRDQKLGMAVAYGDAKDTYRFQLQYDANAEQTLGSVSKVTAQLIPALIGFTPSAAQGIVMGTVLNKYASPTTEADVPLQVRAQSGEEAFYFVSNESGVLPINHEAQASLNPGNALFAIFDLAPGVHQLELLYDGDVTDTTDGTLVVFPDSVSLTNLICNYCAE